MTALLDLVGEADCLVYGIGNEGREDDGLGWAFVEDLERGGAGQAQLLRRYQLALEDADLIGRMRRVLFVDSTKDPVVPSYAVTRPKPRLDFTFTSHALSVPALLATCRICCERTPEVWLLAIRGYQWDLKVGLSAGAGRNLDAALTFARSPDPIPTSHPAPTGGVR
ncbi:MAG: hydrogenase maturation protease [Tetrasphaera sp.]